MHTSGYEPELRPAGFRLNIARWPCPLEYEQPAGTHPSAPTSTTLRSWCPKVSPVDSIASCTAATHSLSAALRWPSGQPANCPGASWTRGSRVQPPSDATGAGAGAGAGAGEVAWATSMHTSGYEAVLRPDGFRFHIARWPCRFEYEQPPGTKSSGPRSTYLTA